MPTECCVPQCKGRGGHAWPLSDPQRVKAWLAAAGREEKWRPTKHSVVCKAHFDEEDYECKTSSGILIFLSLTKIFK